MWLDLETLADFALIAARQGKDVHAGLLARFEEGLPGRLGEWRDALSGRDRARLARVAHSLKGAAAGLGLTALSARAAEAEELAAAADWEGLAAVEAGWSSCWQQSLQALAEHRARSA